MKVTKLFLIVLLTVLAIGNSITLLADSRIDTLPLGPSKYKLLIDKIEKDQIIRTDTAKAVTVEDIVNQNPKTDVFIIGEAHDNYRCHAFQRDFIEALVKKYPKLVVGFEFFWREDNEILEQWRTGQISEEELIKKTGWYERGGQNYGYTRLIMEIIKKYKIKTIGLNVPRSILRTISRKGFKKLTPEEVKLFPTINIPNPQHEFFIKSVFGIFAAQVPWWFNNIYSAQKGWDVVMAESMRQTLEKRELRGYKGVIIAGSNHVSYKLGIPFRYKKANRKAVITTIVPVLFPKEKKEDETEDDEEEGHPMMKMMGSALKPAVTFSRGIADYVFSAQQPLYHHFPVIGFSVEEKNGKLMVTRVSKKSIAWNNGIRKGDQITAIDNIDVSTKEQLRLLIAKKNWDDSISFSVVKSLKLEKE
jgi:uncharacterized iron-regulated protein